MPITLALAVRAGHHPAWVVSRLDSAGISGFTRPRARSRSPRKGGATASRSCQVGLVDRNDAIFVGNRPPNRMA
jgi:hypothetical protein